jgi:hypothetical protein
MSHIDDDPLNDLDGTPGLQPEQPPAGNGTPSGQIPKSGKGTVSFVPPKPIAKADPIPPGSIVINH